VGYGPTDCFEGAAPAPTLDNTTAAFRRNEGCFDTNQNANDVVTGSPNPRNSSSPVHDCTSLSAYGTANPSSVLQGGSSTLTVYVAGAQNPDSSGVTVTADLSQIGGSPSQSFSGSGSVFTFVATVPANNSTGMKSLPVTVTDAQSRTTNTNILLSVLPLVADHITISQIYGGGGNASATYSADFVELFNRSTSAVDVTNWTIQYQPAATTSGAAWAINRICPTGTCSIAPGHYYLVQLGSGGSTGAALSPDATPASATNIAAGAGKIALVSNVTAVTGVPGNGCPSPFPASSIIDFAGYGTGAGICFEGAAAASGPMNNNTSIGRKSNGCQDTNSNLADFNGPVAVTPRNSSSPANICP
jgi:hypothetical protein